MIFGITGIKTAIKLICGFVIAASIQSPSFGQSEWNIKKLDASEFPTEIVSETREEVRNGLPDGLIATSNGRDIAKAWYILPTKRYTHGILGDAIEAGGLIAQTRGGKRYKLILPKSEVFEDRAPRLVDLDNNGSVEVITIRSSLTKGASVTIYGLVGNALVQKATTGFYGRKNRWLNIAGISNFLGQKKKQIAFVQTPHIGGILFIYRFSKQNFVKVDAKRVVISPSGTNIKQYTNKADRDFSNHVIGSREMRLSAVADVDNNGQSDLAVPSADRETLRIIGITSKGLTELASAKLPSPIDKAIGIQQTGTKGFIVGLENGDVYLVYP